MKKLALVGILAIAGAAASANAFEFRVRFVEQTGPGANDFSVIPAEGLNAEDGAARRVRVQFGVFDTPAGDAPAGGLVGWNVGTITVNGGAANSDERRTPGRLGVWSFAQGPNSNGNPPLPGGDPFEALTEIDATLGTQSPRWEFGDPQPNPTIRGRNAYVSLFEITVDPAAGGATYTIDFGGNLVAAAEWRTVGTPIPPDEENDGMITFAPFPIDPVAFASTLTVIVPAPGAAALLGLGGLVALRRRR